MVRSLRRIMIIQFLFFLLLIQFCACMDSGTKVVKEGNETLNDTLADPKVDQLGVDSVEVGYYGDYEKLAKFTIIAAKEGDFSALDSVKSFEMVYWTKGGEHFSINTAKELWRFKDYTETQNNRDFNASEYLGYNSDLKLFAVQNNSVAEGLGFADMTLIDSLTNFKYKIVSLADWAVSLPKSSVHNKFLVYFQNPEYESKTLSIAVLKVGDRSKPAEYLTAYSSCFVDNGLSIEDIRWKTDDTFFIKAYDSELDQNGIEVKTYSYFSAKIN